MTADAPSADSLPPFPESPPRVADRQLPRGMLPGIATGLIAIGLFFGMGGPLWPDVLDAYDVSKSQFGIMTGDRTGNVACRSSFSVRELPGQFRQFHRA